MLTLAELEKKMAAPMESHVKLPYKSVVRKIITRNISILILLGACLSVSLKTGSFLDVVNRTLTSCKLFCALLAVLECLSWAAVVQSSQKRVANVGKCCAVIFLSSVVFHGIAILYGAPLLESSGETYHLAMLLSVTTVLPASCVLGPHPALWVRVFLLNMPELGVESTVHMSSVCSLVGAWLGAFPIPLDWDRPWQVWPVSCVLGNLSGCCVGLLVSTCHLLYRTRSRKSKLF